ncbi:unnamed protein product [Ceutorhynchus assimilis]|uniref:Uncharacterized protein n=1 Tax=Ceutorhynchus assimilis TaxID=467358 RepID=A0A9P0GQ21_9CUCU|nr:unnamed protein product [Ceutorhynchus assimilis]
MENEQLSATNSEQEIFENQQIEEISQIHLPDTMDSQTSLVTIIEQRPLVVVRPRPQSPLTQLLNSATNNLYEEYPYLFKTIGFGVLLTVADKMEEIREKICKENSIYFGILLNPDCSG